MHLYIPGETNALCWQITDEASLELLPNKNAPQTAQPRLNFYCQGRGGNEVIRQNNE